MLILPALLLTFPFVLQDEAEEPSQEISQAKSRPDVDADAVGTAGRLIGLEFTDSS